MRCAYCALQSYAKTVEVAGTSPATTRWTRFEMIEIRSSHNVGTDFGSARTIGSAE
jgi:hypothetical protein